VDHEGEDAHLGGTAVVQLDGLAALDGEVGVVSLALGLDVLLDGSEAKLDGTDGEDGEGKAGSGEGVEGGKAVLDLVGAEGHAGTGGGHDVAEDGKHRDAAVLVLDGAEAVEALLVSVGEQTCNGDQEEDIGLGDFFCREVEDDHEMSGWVDDHGR
jgi:hypothetical protein